MGHSPLTDADGDVLLGLADAAIRHGLSGFGPLIPELDDLPTALRRNGAAFVTVRVHGQLNGCIGSMQADEPLGVAVARHAWQAAFADPRLPRLTSADYPDVDLHVSVLSPMEPIEAASAAVVLDQLTVGIHGLLLRVGSRRATFLPSVWDSVSDPREFLRLLFRKAGLPVDPWVDPWPHDITAFRYRTQDFERHPAHRSPR